MATTRGLVSLCDKPAAVEEFDGSERREGLSENLTTLWQFTLYFLILKGLPAGSGGGRSLARTRLRLRFPGNRENNSEFSLFSADTGPPSRA